MTDHRQQRVQDILDRFEPLENLIQELCDMADDERRSFHLPQALMLCEEGVQAAIESGDLRAEGICRMHQWAVYFLDQKLTDAASECKQARSKFDDLGDTFSEINSAIALGMTYEAQGLRFKSLGDETQARAAYQNALRAYHYDDAMAIVEENRHRTVRGRAAARANDYERLLDDLKEGFKRATARYVHAVPVGSPRPLGDLNPIPVLAQTLPAGKLLPTVEDIEGYARVVGDRAHIAGKEYRIQLLGTGRGTGFAPNQKDFSYYIAPVKGDSMNKVDVQDGDFVLLQRAKVVPVTPTTSDIVAAVIDKLDTYVTLKRFAERGGKFALDPESSNPVHKTREFNPADWKNQVKIAAIAVAVLKKVSS